MSCYSCLQCCLTNSIFSSTITFRKNYFHNTKALLNSLASQQHLKAHPCADWTNGRQRSDFQIFVSDRTRGEPGITSDIYQKITHSMCSIIKTQYSYHDNRKKKLQLSNPKYCLCHFKIVEMAQRKVSGDFIRKEIKADFANLV